MSTSGTIEHHGTVQEIETNSLVIKILPDTACAGCHEEGYCSLSGKKEKTINVAGKYNVSNGDTVTVLMKQSMGYNALFLGYIMPLLLLLTGLILLVSLSVPELIAGLISIAILIPYFFTLYFFRELINKRYTFTLKI